MAYRIKTVRYQNFDCHILLQNENGPCPLLAAANVLLLRRTISLPSKAVSSRVASIDDVINALADYALRNVHNSYSKQHWTSTGKITGTCHNNNNNDDGDEQSSSSSSSVHIHELLDRQFPKLQRGLDVNPHFTHGIRGVEYTAAVSVFDLLDISLVHGWLVDPQDVDLTALVTNQSYNQICEFIVRGKDATCRVQELQTKLDTNRRQQRQQQQEALVSSSNDNGSNDDNKKNTNTNGGNQQDEQQQQDEWVKVEPSTTATATVIEGTTTTTTTGVTNGAAGGGKDKNENKHDEVTGVSSSIVKTERSSTHTQEPTTTATSINDRDGDVSEQNDNNTTVETTITTTTLHIVDSVNTPEVEAEAEADVATSTTNKNVTATSLSSSSSSSSQRLAELKRQEEQLVTERDRLAVIATNASHIEDFVCSTGHQLTHYGLHELYANIPEEALCVFFRNNHFATLTKHGGVLYLLVTDLGYANVPDVMWEKMDGIDGDTEYVNSSFGKSAPQVDLLTPPPGPSLSPEDVLSQRGQVDRDLQLALQLSKHDASIGASHGTGGTTTNRDEEEGRLMAAATEASLRTYHGMDDRHHEDDDEEEKVEVSPSSSSRRQDGTVVTLPPTIASVGMGMVDGCSTQEDSDKLIAMQMQAQLDDDIDAASLSLARKLQEQERHIAAAAATQANDDATAANANSPGRRRRTNRQTAGTSSSSAKDSNCVIS